MKDLQNSAKQIQIFYTFVTNYDILSKTIRELALSGDANDYMRAEGLCNVIGEFMYGKDNMEELRAFVQTIPYPDKLAGVVQALLKELSSSEESLHTQLQAKYHMLLDVLLLRDTIRPSESPEEEDEDMARMVTTMIKQDPGHVIHPDDLKVLNGIATANINKDSIISDFTKKFKTPETKEAIKRLYHEVPYYFEQAFSNTDVRIQYMLLEIIEEDSKIIARDKKRKEALQALRDLYVLATIDTSANKMTSKVSDHQAFELFLNVLSKNNNDFIIRKLINDNVIMGALLDISAISDEKHYGFRRMFVTAKHPYDAMIVTKFRELKKISSDAFLAIVGQLVRDDTFRESYENYQKTERTHLFMDQIKGVRKYLSKKTLTDNMIYEICTILEEFAKLDDYNHDILTVDMVMEVVGEIYGHIIREHAFGKYSILEGSLDQFFRYRVEDALNSTRLEYKAFGGELTFGITPQDLWYDIHRMIGTYSFYEVKTVFLRCEENRVYRFDVGGPLEIFNGTDGESNMKGEGNGAYSFMCSNSDSKGFEQFVFNLYGRFVKAFMNDYIETKLSSVNVGRFNRKTETPGLSSKDDKQIRKAILDYMTLNFLWTKDDSIFMHVYKMRVDGVLKAIAGIEMGIGQVKQYLSINSNDWAMGLLSSKKAAQNLSDAYKKLQASPNTRTFAYKEHARDFFELAQP